MNIDQIRALCFHLIDTMPEDGLEETLATLRDYHTFYSTPKATSIPPSPTIVESNFIGTVERPPLYVDGDET